MHSTNHITNDRFHDGLLWALSPYVRSGLRLNGQDLSDESNWDQFIEQHKMPGTPIELSAHTGDGQYDRDLVHLGQNTLEAGQALWPSPPPPTHYNMAANALRAVAGLPQEGQQVIPDHMVDRNAFPHLALRVAPPLQQTAKGNDPEPEEEKEEREDERHEDGEQDDGWYPDWKGPDEEEQKEASFSWSSAEVSSDMEERTAKWSVIALGETQLPGATGIEPEYNPVTDGPNPNGMNVGDNAQNSPEQEAALQTWVNMAVDLLNRGTPEEGVLAQLAHDGCPDPQAVIQRAQQQPMDQSPVSDEIGQDPFEVPPQQDQTGSMESVSQQPPVLGKVRVKGTSLVGREVERYEDTWGQGTVRIALDGGGTLNVGPESIEPADETTNSPVMDIQSFIDSFPAVQPHAASIMARLTNLKQAKMATLRALKDASFSEQCDLDALSLRLDEEMLQMRAALRSEDMYGDDITVQAYTTHGLEIPGVDHTADRLFMGNVREAALIWAAESPYTASTEDLAVESAVMHARSLNMTGDQTNVFVAAVRERIADKTSPAIEKVAATVDNDGPAEALFV